MSFQNASLPIQLFVNNYGNTGRSYNILEYVRRVSGANTSINLQPNTFLNAPGKLRQVIMNYWPILCDPDGACDADICGEGTEAEPAQQIFDITRCTASKIYSLSKDNVRLTDAGDWDFTGIVRNIVNSLMPQMRRQLALDWLTYLYELAGTHTDGTETKRVTTTNNATGVVNPIGRFDINREYLDAGLTEPYVTGGTEVYNWQAMVGIGGLNAQGQRIDQLSLANTWYDDGLSAELLNDLVNGDHLLAIAPEMFKYVFYLENAGIFRTTGIEGLDVNTLFMRGTETVLNTTLIDPVTGIPWDLDIYFSPCLKKVNFRIKHQWDFFVMPAVACNIASFNGITHWRSCPQIQVQCPAGSPIESPAAATVYNWNPSFTYPLLVSQMTIGGVSTNPNVTITNDTDLVAMMNDNYQPGSPIFTLVGANVTYSGYTALSGGLNNDTVTITFA